MILPFRNVRVSVCLSVCLSGCVCMRMSVLYTYIYITPVRLEEDEFRCVIYVYIVYIYIGARYEVVLSHI